MDLIPRENEESDSDERAMVLVEEVELLRSIIDRVIRIHEPKYKHQCWEWDGLEIDEFDPEFGSCTCFSELNE
jgi:hypothetical protein